jgi:hypothetical protein
MSGFSDMGVAQSAQTKKLVILSEVEGPAFLPRRAHKPIPQDCHSERSEESRATPHHQNHSPLSAPTLCHSEPKARNLHLPRAKRVNRAKRDQYLHHAKKAKTRITPKILSTPSPSRIAPIQTCKPFTPRHFALQKENRKPWPVHPSPIATIEIGEISA